MRVKLDDLKKALANVEANSKDEVVSIKIDSHIYISYTDRYDVQVEIKISENGNMLPKIRKEDVLR